MDIRDFSIDRTYKNIKYIPKEKFIKVNNDIESLDNLLIKKSKKQKLFCLSGNIFDLYKIIKKYNISLEHDFTNDYREKYSSSSNYFSVIPNTCIISNTSMYGNKMINMNINGFLIKYSFSYKGVEYKKLLNVYNDEEIRLEDIVILDIETTGLSAIFDDIIEIAFYDIETENSFRKYLPLNKRNEILKSISDINHITKEDLLDATPLNQSDIDNIIKDFNLLNKKIGIWTGKNYFDAIFLKIYFEDNNLVGFNNLSFINLKEYVKEECGLYSENYSKDFIALKLGISIEGSHTALNDCIIESEILKQGFIAKNMPHKINVIQDIIDDKINEENALFYYDKMIQYCREKNGFVFGNYDENPRKRGTEWIEIHHIYEIYLDDIAKRTEKAKKDNDTLELEVLKPYNKSINLVYANVLEHFFIHYIINFYRGKGGGPHWLFGYILRSKYKIGSLKYQLSAFEYAEECFKNFDFKTLVDIYKRIINRDKLQRETIVQYYMLNETNIEIDNIIDYIFENKLT